MPDVRGADPSSDEADPAVVAGRRAEAARLRDAAQRLRSEAAALPAVLRDLAAYDRPDVWQGRVADRYRIEVREVVRRVTSPFGGAAVGLVEAAARLEARARALDETIDGPSW